MVANMEAQVVRRSTVKTVRRGVRDYSTFAPAHYLPLLPRRDVDLLEYISYSIHFRGRILDASTVCNYVGSCSTYLAALGRGLRINLYNPTKTARVRNMLKVARDIYKLPSKAKEPWTIKEVKRMLDKGFLDTRSGRHRRLQLWFHTLGVLRKGAGSRLRVMYTIVGKRVYWHPDSPIKVLVAGDGNPFIQIRVKDDKNVKAWKIRTSYIPHYVT